MVKWKETQSQIQRVGRTTHKEGKQEAIQEEETSLLRYEEGICIICKNVDEQKSGGEIIK